MSVSTSNFITSGLVCHLDAFKHSGTGTTWSDLNRTYNGTLVGTPPYTHPTKNALNSLNGGTGATYNYSVSPDGAKNGIRVWNTPSVNSYFTFNNGTPNTVTGQVYTISFYGKADTANSLLFVESFYNDKFNVNLNTATISNLGPNVNSSSVTNAGNGWYRYSVTFTPTSAHVMTRVMYVGAYGNTATQHYAQVYGFQIVYGSAVPFAPSFLFDNSTQYVTSTIPDSFWNSASWTVSTWVNFAQVNKGLDNAIIGHGTAATNNGMHLGERAGKPWFGFYSNDLGFKPSNLVAFSNTFTDAKWVGYFSKPPSLSKTETDPFDVPNNASSFLISDATFGPNPPGYTGLIQLIGPLPNNTTLTVSCWMKSDVNSSVRMGITDGVNSVYTVTPTWTRYVFTGNYLTSGNRGFQINVLGNQGLPGGTKLYIYGAQTEVGGSVTSYIENTGTVTVQHLISPTTLVANTWYNIVGSYDNTTKTKSMYVNGVFNGSGGTVGYTGTGSNTRIGQYSWNTTHKMFGAIASISIYDRVLDQTEITSMYKNTKGRYLQ